MSKFTFTDEHRNTARDHLADRLPAGTRIFYTTRRRSESGLTTWVDFYIIRDLGYDGEHDLDLVCITFHVCALLGITYSTRHEAAEMGGVGTDLGYGAIHHLGVKLHGDGYAFRTRQF